MLDSKYTRNRKLAFSPHIFVDTLEPGEAVKMCIRDSQCTLHAAPPRCLSKTWELHHITWLSGNLPKGLFLFWHIFGIIGEKHSEEHTMEFIYQDSSILVCVKPAGVLSTDEPGGMPELARAALGEPQGCVRTVHRLDRVVSCLLYTSRCV